MYNFPRRIIKLKKIQSDSSDHIQNDQEQKIRRCDTTRLKNEMRILTKN